MRRVPMHPGFLDQLRQCRHPLIAVVVALVLLQSLVAGLATAQAALANPLDASALCHGAGEEPPASGAPASGMHRELCCTFCAATAPALLAVTPPVVGRIGGTGADRLSVAAHDLVAIPRYAVRAGPSQAPPSVA